MEATYILFTKREVPLGVLVVVRRRETTCSRIVFLTVSRKYDKSKAGSGYPFSRMGRGGMAKRNGERLCLLESKAN